MRHSRTRNWSHSVVARRLKLSFSKQPQPRQTYLKAKGESTAGERYFQAGLKVTQTLFSEPYLSTDPKHHGLILHSIYHQPNGWDHKPDPAKAAYGESSMWGDYHAMELAVYLQRLIKGGPYLTFFA